VLLPPLLLLLLAVVGSAVHVRTAVYFLFKISFSPSNYAQGECFLMRRTCNCNELLLKVPACATIPCGGQKRNRGSDNI
jgi:hypothetical protein